VYNKNGDFKRVLTANWNPGTPTADANFGGWINFGGQIGTRTALHEIAHCLVSAPVPGGDSSPAMVCGPANMASRS